MFEGWPLFFVYLAYVFGGLVEVLLILLVLMIIIQLIKLVIMSFKDE
jgi:TRAP-type C4-dicarboxylate transport system permease small subunit